MASRVFLTHVFYPAINKVDVLEALFKKHESLVRSDFPGVLEWQVFNVVPTPIHTPPHSHGGQGGVVLPKMIGHVVFKNEEAYQDYHASSAFTQLLATTEKEGLFRQAYESLQGKPITGFERKAAEGNF
ncbi:hypothetical protein B7494_g6553 [Chlorociboria aeruginascens]|nr:hypothetical protein B7494_g6553 [Chlorociboria aeruginascens]